jgi:RNA polymerase sigma-70 factor (ECF subfamily)
LRPDDRTGFPAFYQQYGDRIYRFCYRLSGSASDAEDLTQDVFLAAFQGRNRFEGRSSVQTWLYRIALNCWRHSRRAPRLDTTDLESVRQAGPDLAQSVTNGIALTCALAALPPDLREAFLLVKAEGLKYREAAQVLNVPIGTVQFRVHQASRRLRVLLTEEDGEGS